jgi:hypothetical protein
MLVPILVLALGSIYFGLDTELSAGIAGRVAETLLGGLK